MSNETNNATERVNGFVEIDRETATVLIQAYRNDYEVQYIERFIGGRSTSNYKVHAKGATGPLVLRFYPQNNTTGDKELAINGRVRELVPVPEIYYFDNRKSVIPYSYAVMEYLEGTPLDEYIRENQGLPEVLAEEIGEKLAILHQLEYDREGFLDSNLELMEGLPPIRVWYEYFLNGRAGARLDESTRERMIAFKEGYQSLLDHISKRFVLCHGDFRPANLMVKNDRVVGFMDWEFSLSAPCYFDIGQFIRDNALVDKVAEESLIRGYNRIARYPVGKDWMKLSKGMDLMNLMSMLDSKEERPILHGNLKKQVAEYLKAIM